MSKLKEAREVVDSLKKKAAQQSQILAEKQREADESMAEITSTIQVSYCSLFSHNVGRETVTLIVTVKLSVICIELNFFFHMLASFLKCSVKTDVYSAEFFYCLYI